MPAPRRPPRPRAGRSFSPTAAGSSASWCGAASRACTARPTTRVGLAALLAVEDQARQKRRGLWRRETFAVRDAGEAARDAGTWQIVEGTVVDVAHVEDGAFIHFGADWRTAFRAHLGRDAEKLCRAAGLDAKSLAGARVRVRGFIDGTRRPTIEVTFPEQIERL